MAASKPVKGKAAKGAVPAKGTGKAPPFPGAVMPFAKGGGRARKAPAKGAK